MDLSSSSAGQSAQPPFDALLRPRQYNPRDFAFYEDVMHRWIAVALFGLIVFGVSALVLVPRVPLTSGAIILVFLGGVVILALVGFLTEVEGEAGFAGLAAGLTLVVVGLLGLSGTDPSWPMTVVGLVVAGISCMVLGGGKALMARSALLAYAEPQATRPG
jgi:hypothetical protein